MANETHKITINGRVASIVLADVYDTTNSNIGDVLGIEKLGENETLPPGTFPIDIGNGLKNGLLARLAIRRTVTTNGVTRSRTSRIVCPIDKAPEAISGLVGKQYNGSRVQSVSIPQRRRLT